MKFAPLLGSNLTGRLGGIVASHNSSGTYFRRYVVPVNPNTTGQQAQRNAFAVVSQRWRGLNSIQQAAWVAAGPQNTVPNSTGGSLQLTGQQLFMRMNTLRQRIGLPLVDDAPTSDVVPAITTPAVLVALNGDISITFDNTDEWNALGGGILISSSPLLSNGRNFNNAFLATLPHEGFQGPISGSASGELAYSTVAGGRIQFRFSAVTPDGRLSDYVYVDVDTLTQAIVTGSVILSATQAEFFFSRNVDVADFTAADMDIDGTPSTLVAQGDPNSIIWTNTTISAGDAWTLIALGAAGFYTPNQTGLLP